MKPQLIFLLFLLLPHVTSSLNFLPVPPLWWEEVNLFYSGYYLCFHLFAVISFLCFHFGLKPRARMAFVLWSAVLLVGYAARFAPFFSKPEFPASIQSEEEQPEVLSVLFAPLNPLTNTESLKTLVFRKLPTLVAVSGLTEKLDLSKAENLYHSTYEVPRADGFGVALYSRIPILDAQVLNLESDLPPVLSVTLDTLDTPLRVLLFKTPAPFSAEAYHQTKLLVRRLSTPLRHTSDPLLVLAQLNAPQSSLSYNRLRKAAKLSDAMKGYGILKTWHESEPLLHFTLSHVLYRGNLKPLNYVSTESVGGGHIPMLVEFEFFKPFNVQDAG